MGIGVISLQTSQKREQSGPPFVSGSADNGASVDPVTGRIVLGNNVGAAGSPAQLLSNREIITEDALLNLFAVILNSIQTGITTSLDGQTIQMLGSAGTSPRIDLTTSANGDPQINLTSSGGNGNAAISLTGSGGGDPRIIIQTDGNGIALLQIGSNPDTWGALSDGTGLINFEANGTAIWQIDTTGLQTTTQIASSLANANGATLQVTGTLTARRFLESHGAGTFNVDRDLDSGKIFRNSAATNYALPNMAAANLREGFTIGASCNNAAGITVTASAGQTIRFGSLATSSGGTLSSTDVGAFCRITLQDAGTWFTECFEGVWVLT